MASEHMVECDRLWLRDGTIVLAATRRRNPDPSDVRVLELFKVSREAISQHSLSLNALIDKRIDGSVKKEYNGLPFVHLPYDAEDLRVFLQVAIGRRCDIYRHVYPRLIHISVEIRLLAPGTETHDLLAGALRLAVKHKAERVKRSIVQIIRRDWPSNLLAWDVHDALLKSSPGPDPVTTIRLATECNIPAILPAAFYHFSRLQYRSREDPSVARALKTSAAQTEDFQMLLAGREQIRSYIARRVLDLDEELARGATSVSNHISCWKAIAGWSRVHVLRALLYGSGVIDPLHVLADLNVRIHKDLPNTRACGKCRDWTCSWFRDTREAVWNSLPLWFGIFSTSASEHK